MIQNLVAFSQKDPDVIQKLLALLKDKQSPSGSDNNEVLEDLKQKLVEAQERQRREASEHFKTQTEFHQLMKRHLEETAEMQMKVCSIYKCTLLNPISGLAFPLFSSGN